MWIALRRRPPSGAVGVACRARHELIELVVEAYGAMGMPAAQCAKWRRKLWGHWPFYVSWCLRIDGWYPGWRVALERMRASGTMPAEAEVEDV